jgi:hypothetical protein
MQEALAANGEVAPEGSLDPVREPIPDAGELAKDMEARLSAEEAAAESGEEVPSKSEGVTNARLGPEGELADGTGSTPRAGGAPAEGA